MKHDTARSSMGAGSRLHTRSGTHQLEVRVASTFASRFLGLMLRKSLPPDTGLLIVGCPSVHTAFMRFAIDVVYLDAYGVVTRCVPEVRPWRGSISDAGRDAQGRRHQRAVHTLELAAGSIARWALAPGDRLEHALWGTACAKPQPAPGKVRRQRGSAMTEFVVVGPILTVIGLSLIQYGLLFFAKNQINHAAFMAARAGSVGNADPARIGDAYAQALVPMYGGGSTAGELAEALARAKADVLENSRIDMLNPTRESFAEWNEPALQAKFKTGSRHVIPNAHQATKSHEVRPASGQSIQDANLLKLRITHGVEPQVPIVASIYRTYLKWLDDGTDPLRTKLIEAGRIPVATHVTVQMQSDAIEPDTTVSSPGPGDGGAPTDPGGAPGGTAGPGTPPPNCQLGGCSTPGPGGGSGGAGGGTSCPAPISQALSADTLFAFDSSTLLPAGTQALDQLIERAKALGLDLETIKVTGYTDPLGSDAHNLALSKARAEAVANYLSARGLTAPNVEVQGLGATNFVTPLSACPAGPEQKACLAPNRRVVVELIPQ